MPYWRLFYHLVWSTKGRLPLLTPDVEPLIHGFIRGKATELDCTVFALDGTLDHVHLVAAIPPKLAVATLVGQVKGVSSSRFNKSYSTHSLFAWHESYGACSFDAKRLVPVIAYVAGQKEHHRLHTIIAALEQDTDPDQPELAQSIAEAQASYQFQTSTDALGELAAELAAFDHDTIVGDGTLG